MSLFKLTSQRDLDRGPNGTGFSRVVKQEEARAALQTILYLVQPECKRDIRAGLDHEMLFDPRIGTSAKANHIAATMLGVPGVTDVELSYSLVTETGVLSVDANVTYDEADQEGRRTRREQFLIDPGQDTGGTV